jgi:S1-C subfamily serine protease
VIRLALAGAAAVAAAACLAGCSGGDDEAATTITRTVTAATVDGTVTEAPARRFASLADMIERVLPSVVYVKTTTFGGGRGEGSGVVLDRRGVIVTNNHVIEGTTSVDVTFNDGKHRRPLRGEVIGVAEERDLAVIRVTASDLVPVQIGRSSRLRLGDGVVAIGFPLGLGGPTVTQGIVSGLDRTIEPDSGPKLEDLLQTDAAINPGNSGGALVDSSGRLIGINTAKAVLDGGENVGFAIAIEEALPVIARIRNQPSSRAWLGIAFGSVESAQAAVRLGLDPSVRGVVVTDVYPGGPGVDANLAVGDVIVRLDGARIASSAALTRALAAREPGTRVELELIDSAGPRLAELTLAKRPATLPR